MSMCVRETEFLMSRFNFFKADHIKIMDHVKHSRSEFGCPAHFPVLKWQNPNKEREKLIKEKFQQFEEEVCGLSHE